jgi:hypothetical protein
VLLLGDDTVPSRELLAAHLQTAAGREIAVQGRIDWDPSRPITEVMRFLAPAGPQFWFEGLVDGGPAPFSAMLASNLSAPTRWFREEPFDERFTEACLEDTELAWRWQQRGWPVMYSEGALCWHRHYYDRIEPFLDHQRRRWARLAVATTLRVATLQSRSPCPRAARRCAGGLVDLQCASRSRRNFRALGNSARGQPPPPSDLQRQTQRWCSYCWPSAGGRARHISCGCGRRRLRPCPPTTMNPVSGGEAGSSTASNPIAAGSIAAAAQGSRVDPLVVGRCATRQPPKAGADAAIAVLRGERRSAPVRGPRRRWAVPRYSADDPSPPRFTQS